MVERIGREKENLRKEVVLRSARVATRIENLILKDENRNPDGQGVLKKIDSIVRDEDLPFPQRIFAKEAYSRFEMHRSQLKEYKNSVGVTEDQNWPFRWHNDTLRERLLEDVGLSRDVAKKLVSYLHVSDSRPNNFYILIKISDENLDAKKEIWEHLNGQWKGPKGPTAWVVHKNPKVHPLLQNKIIWFADEKLSSLGFRSGGIKEQSRAISGLMEHETSHILDYIYFPKYIQSTIEGPEEARRYIDFRTRSELAAGNINYLNIYRVLNFSRRLHESENLAFDEQGILKQLEYCKQLYREIPKEKFGLPSFRNIRLLSLVTLFSEDLSSAKNNLEYVLTRKKWFESNNSAKST